MLPIYICDDDRGIRSRIREELENYILIQNYDMKVVLCTGEPEQVIRASQEEQRRGIYFLDVDLKHEVYDGFRLGREIRKEDSRGFLIYVTSFADLAFETFRYHLEALDYIVKDHSGRMLDGIRRCLDTVVKRMKEEEKAEEQEFFTCKTSDRVYHIPVCDICCFETSDRTHRIMLYADSECLDFIGKLSDLEEQLGGRFIRTHRSFLVNKDKIKQLNIKQSEVVLTNGQKCLVSRKAKPLLKEVIDAV